MENTQHYNIENDKSTVNSLDEYPIVGIKFKSKGKTYYFDPIDFNLKINDHVIVETSRGIEYGTVTLEKCIVKSDKIVLPLKKILRVATESDEKKHKENIEKENEAYNTCLDKIEEHNLNMKLIDVEYAFDNSKLLFYFSSEGRVDFRNLVKDLASIFHTRIELRQIGIRDEAKIMGGLGVCGRKYCCCGFLDDFVQVSIKMAKDQNLSLNSSKISGACGRLMCCLKYEHDTYCKESENMPKVDDKFITPDGEGQIVEINPLNKSVKVKIENNQTQIIKWYKIDNPKIDKDNDNENNIKTKEFSTSIETTNDKINKPEENINRNNSNVKKHHRHHHKRKKHLTNN